ncbi:MAG: hypothetical protein ACK5GN_01110 [Pseudomonadota bacterium]
MAHSLRLSVDNTADEHDAAGVYKRGLARVLVALVGLAILFSFVPLSLRAKFQLGVFPLVLLMLVWLVTAGVKIPKLILMLASAGVAGGAFMHFSHVNLAAGAFLISTAGDQELRQETKIYRDRLRRAISSDAENLVGIYPGAIRDAIAARRILERGASLGGVIWGGSRWMSVVLRQYDPIGVSVFPEHSVAKQVLESQGSPEFLLIRSVPSVGLSHGKERGTVHFLAEVVRAWSALPLMVSPGAKSGEFEGALESVARTQSRWTSRAHMALPLWLSATVHLVRAVEGPFLQDGELRCAVSQLREALSLFRTNDNPALEMAVRNNYSFALLVQAEFSGDRKKYRQKALRQLAAAMKLRKLDQGLGRQVAVNYLGLLQSRKGGGAYGRRI